MFDFQDEDRIITSTMKNEDIDVENSLRPKSLDDYLGQEKAKEQLKIEMNNLIMFFYMDHQVLVKQL